MPNEVERLQILEMIEKGVITAEEGVRLLNSLQDESEGAETPEMPASVSSVNEPLPEPDVTVEEPRPETQRSTVTTDFASETRKWRRWWWIPLSIGIVITVVSGLLMYTAYQNSGFGFWFACLWFPLLLGVIIISLAATSRTTRWLHVRVHQEPGEWPRTIAISLPIPIRFTAWILRLVKPHIDNFDNANLDELVLALEKTSPEQPIYVKVDEGDTGEKVEVYIG
ncbi:MAG: hypothetical protein C3F13_00965 [Anaerolineales bacterium]|nr:hypothetical protein [Anaerolineae bacterium]PWB56673.1 MAG: hypothetical protein C3F13_00965 [Anaerolineales bacterium]